MANSNSVALRLVVEGTYGTSPGGTFEEVRFTSESLAKTTGTTTSAEIRSDRQITDVVRVSDGVDGAIEGELSYSGLATASSAQDELMEAALMSAAWSAAQTNTGSWTISGSNITGTGVGASLAVGDWVRVKNSATLIGYFFVTAASANSITVTPTPTGAAATEVERGAVITNGTTERSFTIERQHTDVASTFELYTGVKVNSMTLNVAAGSISRYTFALLGQDEVSAAATAASSTTAHTTNPIMNGVDNVFAVRENHASLGTIVRSFSLSVANNHFARQAVGALGPVSMGSGSCVVTGTLSVYFENNTLLDKFRNWTTTNLSFILQDSAGNAYCFHIPECKLTLGRATTPGLNQDITAELSFQGYRDTTYGHTVRVTRWDV
jgi:hypothetical protein